MLALAIAVADQATKLWITAVLPFGAYHAGARIDVIPGFFHLVHLGNTGAAFGIFAGRSPWLAALGIVALGAIWWFRHQLELHRTWHAVAFGLLAGGILGNVVDRIRLGYVVDFLDFHFGSYAWPAFNVADSAITVGVGLYFLLTLFFHQPAGPAPPAERPR